MSEEIRDCFNCKYETLGWISEPCRSCSLVCSSSGTPRNWERQEKEQVETSPTLLEPFSIKDCTTCTNAETEKGCRSCYGFDLWREASNLKIFEVSFQGKAVLQIKAQSALGARTILESYIIEIEEFKS